MKRLLSVILILCIVVNMAACAGGMTSAENALIAIKALDLEAFSSYMTSDSETALARIRSFEAELNDEEKETLRKLYAMLRYTIGEESETSGDTRTIAVLVKLPDMERIRTLADKKILVSAESAVSIVSDMIESGEIAGSYMLDITWQITMREENGKWLIPYTETANAAFVSDLYLLEMLKFFAQN